MGCQVHYTARFPDGTVFDSSYKRGRPLTMRIGAGKVRPAKYYSVHCRQAGRVFSDQIVVVATF